MPKKLPVPLCHKCKCVLTLENCTNSRFRESGAASYCAACAKARMQKYRLDNLEQVRAKEKSYRQRNSEKIKAHFSAVQKKRWRFWKYGVSIDDFRKRLQSQNSQCTICHFDLILKEDRKEGKSYPKNSTPYQDHDHESGITRDVLCNRCNSLLGGARDDIKILENAIKYLQKYQTDLTQQTIAEQEMSGAPLGVSL